MTRLQILVLVVYVHRSMQIPHAAVWIPGQSVVFRHTIWLHSCSLLIVDDLLLDEGVGQLEVVSRIEVAPVGASRCHVSHRGSHVVDVDALPLKLRWVVLQEGVVAPPLAPVIRGDYCEHVIMDLRAISGVEPATVYALDVSSAFTCQTITVPIESTILLVGEIDGMNDFEDLEEREHPDGEVIQVEGKGLSDVYAFYRLAAAARLNVHLVELQNREEHILEEYAAGKHQEGAPDEELDDLAAQYVEGHAH